MRVRYTVAPAAIAAILVLAPVSARADHRGGGRSHGGGHASGGAFVGRSASIGGARFGSASPRGTFSPRVGSFGGPRVVYAAQRTASRGGGRVAPRISGGARVVGRPYGGYYYRPYYTFRPRFSLGFGLWAGYPVGFPYYYGYYPYAYPYAYGYPYGYANPYRYYGYPYGYPYPYASQAPYGYQTAPPGGYVQQGNGSASATVSGGLSFEITPDIAEVYVDGGYVGTAGEFSPSSQPLTLSTGRHHIELRAQNYQTMTFDTDVVPGQVVPYQGTMQPR